MVSFMIYLIRYAFWWIKCNLTIKTEKHKKYIYIYINSKKQNKKKLNLEKNAIDLGRKKKSMYFKGPYTMKWLGVERDEINFILPTESSLIEGNIDPD